MTLERISLPFSTLRHSWQWPDRQPDKATLFCLLRIPEVGHPGVHVHGNTFDFPFVTDLGEYDCGEPQAPLRSVRMRQGRYPSDPSRSILVQDASLLAGR